MEKDVHTEAYFRTLVEGVLDIVAASNRRGIYEYVSPSVEKMLGYLPTELVGKSIFPMLHPADRLKAMKTFAIALLRPEQPQSVQVRHRHKDGSWRVLEAVGKYTRGVSRSFFIINSRDITARVKVEEQRAQLFAAIEYSADSIVIADVTGVIQYVNPAFEVLTGYSRREAVGQNPRILKSGLHDAAFYKQMWAQLQSGKMWAGYINNKRKNGTIFEEDVTITPVKNENGDTINFVAVKRDMTERRKMEKAYRESEEKYRQIFSAARDVFILIDAETRKIVEINSAALGLYGYSREELLRMTIMDLSNEPEKTEAAIEAILEIQGPAFIPLRLHKKKDGTIFPAEITPSSFRLNDRLMVMTSIRDISERTHLESIARQSEKMSAIGQLAAGVAHELNNPLSVILGFAQSLYRRLAASDPSASPLLSIERETLRCKNLVQNLLMFSREHKPGFSVEDPVHMIQNALTLVEPQTRVKNVKIVTDFPPVAPTVQMDGNQLQQVIINLCTNAIDAMPEGGTLTIGLRPIEEAVEIRVTDTGMGIPAAIQAKIWDPFFTTKEAGKGTGLGLSLVYEIVKKHNAQIELQSEEGNGTTFIIRLPIAQKQNSSSRPAIAA